MRHKLIKDAYLAFTYPKSKLSAAFTVILLKELYGTVFIGKDQVIYNLLCAYEPQLSPRLLVEKKRLKLKGELQAKEMFKSLVYTKNPLLFRIPKSDNGGGYLPVPLKY